MGFEFSRGVASLALAAASVVTVGGRVADAALILAVDVNDRASDSTGDADSLTQTGFQSFLLEGATGAAASDVNLGSTDGLSRDLGGYTVNIATANNGLGTGQLADRDRDFLPVPGCV